MLSEKSRSSIFQALSPLVGEEAIGEMLAHYPATPGEQPVGRGHLDAQLAELRADLRSEMSELRAELVVEMHQQTKQLLIWLPTAVAAITAVIAFLAGLI